MSIKDFKTQIQSYKILSDVRCDISLYNEADIIHKLSHQHLHTKFWIITTESNLKEGIPSHGIEEYPVPSLIGDFISNFRF